MQELLPFRKVVIFSFVLFSSISICRAQINTYQRQIPGTPCKECKQNQYNQRQNQNNSPQDGNASNNTSYTTSGCGINWTTGSVVLQQRATFGPPLGQIQPATINIAGIPALATIVKAFLYCDASGNGVPITATVKNPGGGTANFPMTIIGTDVDKCWGGLGYAATYSYRADVTPIVTTNGAYLVSGMPVSPAPGPNDVDGATLIIVYKDPGQPATGTFIIGDGCYVYSGFQTMAVNLTGFTACGASTSAQSFMAIGDLQNINPTNLTMNTTPLVFPAASNLWWNFIQTPTTVTAGQTTSSFTASNAGDCYNIVLCGLYFQSNCAGTLTVTATASAPCTPTSATANPTGGSGTYTYVWSSGQTTQTITGIAPGNYTVTVTDVAGCATGTATVTVPPNTAPVMTVNSATFCPGGSALLTATGATTYAWSPPTGLSATTGASVTANPTVTTTYTVIGTSGTCTASVTSLVTISPLPTITVNNGTICNGGNVVLTANGANTYTWTPPTGLSATTGASVTANPATTTHYTVTGTSAAGCVNTATTVVTVVTNPTVTVNSGTICVGGNIVLNAGGATTYAWTPPGGLSATTGASVTANPATTTVYTVTGTAGTCTATATSTVTVNPLPTVTATSGTICIGQTTANLTAGGANTYTWSPATGLNTTTGANVIANPTVTTNYTVTGTSAAGCINTVTTSVTVNPLPNVAVNNGTICNGGNVVLTATGANTYSWTPPTGLSSTNTANTTATPATTTNYTVTGTSAAGCVNTATTVVNVVTNPTVTVNAATICLGQQTATLTANGATTYAWAPPTGLSATTGASVTANPATTTVYTITGTAGTCTAVATTTVTVNPIPVVTVNSSTICAGQQTATLTAAGANTYTWNPGTGLSSTNTAIVTGNPTVSTNYTVTGTDINGCVSAATSTITVNPLPLVTVNTGFICNGGSANLTAGGANTYSWNPGTGLSSTNSANTTATPTVTTNYTVTGTDVNGCVSTAPTTVTVVNNPTVTVNTSTICVGQQTATLTANGAVTYAWTPPTGLSATTGSVVNANPATTTVYTITGTAGTCTAVATTTVTVNPLPVVTVNSSTICVGQQTATLTATGANSYAWNPGTGLSAITGASVTGNPTITTNYTVTGTDMNSCVSTATSTITVNPLPIVTVNSGTICLGQQTYVLTANGANTYSWNPGTGLSSTNTANTTASPTVTTNYTVTGTDINGCVNTAPTSITVLTNPTVTVNTATICVGQQTATLTATGAGVYNWTPPTGLSSTIGTSVTASPAVTTTYTITGSVGTCTAVGTTTVTVNPLPLITATSGTICINQQTANLTATGGVTYTWTPATGLNTSSGPNVVANPTVTTNYLVTSTDANGCKSVTTTSVLVNPLPVITVNSGTICIGEQTATLTANGAVTYSWVPGTGLSATTGSSVSANPNNTTLYTITGINANGCINATTASVVVNPLPIVNVNSATICQGKNKSLIATGAVTYTWTPPNGLSSSVGGTITASPAATTSYSVTGIDANGCYSIKTTTVTVNPTPSVAIGPKTTSGCAPQCVNFNNSGASTGNCNWNFGDNNTATGNCNPNHCFTTQGSYTVHLTLTDANGCVDSSTATVVVYPVPTAAIGASPQPTTMLDPNIQFTDLTTGANITQWHWSLGDGTMSGIKNPSHIYGDSGTYAVELVVTSNFGCKDSTIQLIRIEPDYMLYVPNAFTPNFDGVNDIFFPKGDGIKDYKLYIFDRWGNMVFYSYDISIGWDGRFLAKGSEIVQEDVYVWKIELHTFKSELKQLSGHVSLLK